MDLEALYQARILDHFRNPRNRRPVETTEAHQHSAWNPACGDRITVAVSFTNGILSQWFYDAQGCAVSVASASIMSETLKSGTVSEVRNSVDRVISMLQDDQHPADEFPEDVAALSSVRRFPMRVRCATLAWKAARECMERLPVE